MRPASTIICIALMMGISFALTGCATSNRTLTVAAVSCESEAFETEANLHRIEQWARQATDAGADLVLFPEATLTGWSQNREIRQHGEPIDGPSIQRFIELADELGITIAVGMTETEGKNAYITHVLLDGAGVIGTHRKSSLAGGKNGEGKTWDQGNDANVFEVAGINVGIAICFESIHPATCRELRANGAEVILAPYANGTEPYEITTGKRPYTFARATENAVWYVACDATPHNKDRSLRLGTAYVISPQGQLVAITQPDAPSENMVLHQITLPPRTD